MAQIFPPRANVHSRVIVVRFVLFLCRGGLGDFRDFLVALHDLRKRAVRAARALQSQASRAR